MQATVLHTITGLNIGGAEVMLARLDETPLTPLSHSAHSVAFVAEPRAIVTIVARVVSDVSA